MSRSLKKGPFVEKKLFDRIEAMNQKINHMDNAVTDFFNKMSDVLATLQGKLLFMGMMAKMMPKGKDKGEAPKAMGFEINEGMMQMMGGFTVLRLTNMMGMMNIHMTKEQLLDLNAKLNKIKRPKK